MEQLGLPGGPDVFGGLLIDIRWLAERTTTRISKSKPFGQHALKMHPILYVDDVARPEWLSVMLQFFTISILAPYLIGVGLLVTGNAILIAHSAFPPTNRATRICMVIPPATRRWTATQHTSHFCACLFAFDCFDSTHKSVRGFLS